MSLKDHVAATQAPTSLEALKQDLNARQHRSAVSRSKDPDHFEASEVSDGALNIVLLRIASVVAYADEIAKVARSTPETIAMANVLSSALNMLNGTDPMAGQISPSDLVHPLSRTYVRKSDNTKKLFMLQDVRSANKDMFLVQFPGKDKPSVISKATLDKDWRKAIPDIMAIKMTSSKEGK